MTNDEIKMTKEVQTSKPEIGIWILEFEFPLSFVIRVSSFVIPRVRASVVSFLFSPPCDDFFVTGLMVRP